MCVLILPVPWRCPISTWVLFLCMLKNMGYIWWFPKSWGYPQYPNSRLGFSPVNHPASLGYSHDELETSIRIHWDTLDTPKIPGFWCPARRNPRSRESCRTCFSTAHARGSTWTMDLEAKSWSGWGHGQAGGFPSHRALGVPHGTPKSSILMRGSTINHPSWGPFVDPPRSLYFTLPRPSKCLKIVGIQVKGL